MKLIKKCPLFLILISTFLLLTLVGVAGRMTVYAEMDYDPLKTPALALVFTGWNEDIYPWQIWGSGSDVVAAGSEEVASAETKSDVESMTDGAGQTDGAGKNGGEEELMAAASPSASAKPDKQPTTSPTAGETAAPDKTVSGTDEENLAEAGAAGDIDPATADRASQKGRLEPLRESTHDEYMNHISADIYGDAGVLRASEYAFSTVGEDYFDDALFIGDSRTVGLRDYTTLADHADFYCETSLTIYKVLEENFKGKGTISDALARKDYGKIYIMVGINELGRGTTEDFMAQYTEVIDTLHELEPDALIFIQGIMRVSGEKNASDAIFNNSNINARNNAIATLADNEQIFYIDMNEAVCDEEGNLTEDYTFDQIHLLGMYNDLWKQFLLEHGVVK